MYKDKKILAMIPARGGSKRLPRKNIRELHGRPLIAWTIEEAKKSRYIDRIIVSTDNKEIAEVSKRFGVEVPFLRPKELAQDETKTIDVVRHTIEWAEKESGEVYGLLITLQPTSPLRSSEDIDNAVELLFKKNAKAIVSVCEAENHPYWSNVLPKDGCMDGFVKPENESKNHQDFPAFYRLNGVFRLAYIDYFKKEGAFFGRDTYAYIMPRERSVDINDEMDFDFAEFLMKNKK